VRRLAVAALAVGAATLTACTSSTTGNGSGASQPPVVSTSPTDTLPATDTAVATDTVPATPTSTAASTSPSPTHTGPPDCTSGALMVRVIRGSAAQQQEFALITYTNTSTAACSMNGYPTVALLLNGAQLGKPAGHSSVAAKQVTLAPGVQAESLITDFSACQAPLSDTVRVVPPGTTTAVEKPAELRGCSLIVDPVSLSK
jgi:Protein of unknown function (DUF4232)